MGRKAAFCLILGGLVVSTASAAQDTAPISSDNWLIHPKILEIRAIYREIRSGIESGQYRPSTRSFIYCEPYQDGERELSRDSQGSVHYYRRLGGSGDSALNSEFFFDSQGRLRFAYITGGAVNGTEISHRIYFDAGGERIWEMHEILGPGWTFPDVWPQEWLVLDPEQAFAGDSPCEES